jgi:putative Ca2+/H+ antiporter (TMEM165/GDT1 family)
MRERLNSLGARTTPCYGFLVLVVALAFAGLLCLRYTSVQSIASRAATYRGIRLNGATVLWLLPEAALHSERTIQIANYTFWIGSLLWLANLLLPWTSWLSCLSFMSVVALQFENSNGMHHAANMISGLLFVSAIWYHFYAREIRAAMSARALFRSPVYPRWVYLLSVCYVSLFYASAGFSKIATSGLGWVNGVSLQLWVFLWGDRTSTVATTILSSRNAATVFQGCTLLLEVSTILAIPFARLRPWIGLALLGFHHGISEVFHYEFDFNAILLALVLLPFLPVVSMLGKRIWPDLPQNAQPVAAIPKP